MDFFLQRGPLRDLYDKVASGTRLNDDDALRLFLTTDLNSLGAIADFANRRRNGLRATYIVNRYLNYSNYCILSCQFCAFSRKKGTMMASNFPQNKWWRKLAKPSLSALPNFISSEGFTPRFLSPTIPVFFGL